MTGRLVLAAATLATLAACGQTDPPTTADLELRLSDPDAYFEVTRPDGSTMWCNQFGDESTNTQDSKSWFAFSCDWGGDYDPRGSR